MNNLSVITVMRNEWPLAEQLGKSISWCDDWHIVDTEDVSSKMTDAGASNLRSLFGDRVKIHHDPIPLGESFDAARAKALPHIHNNWILIIDTDERVPPTTLGAIRSAIAQASPNLSGFWLPRLNHVLGMPLLSAAYWPDWQLRVVRKDAVTFPSGIHRKYTVRGETEHFPKTVNTAIQHFNFRSNDQYLEKISVYSTIEARTGHSPPLPPIKALWPAARFLLTALFKMGGIRDGHAGVHLSICMAFYRYISCVKAWEMINVSQGFPDAPAQPDEVNRS